MGACPHHQVKRNLLNVSYRIAQYTDVISDLRREIEHLKSKIEKQDKEKKSDPSVLDIQGSLSTAVPPAGPDGSVPSSLEPCAQHPHPMGHGFSWPECLAMAILMIYIHGDQVTL